jgi:hypothetical protein
MTSKLIRAIFGAALTFTLSMPAEAQLISNGGGNGGSGGGVSSVATGACLTGGPITSTGTIATTVTPNAQTGTSYALASTDGCKFVSGANAAAQGFTLSSAATAGFTSGYGFDLYNYGAGALTLTATTSTFGNALSTLVLATGQDAYVASDGTNYTSVVSLPVMAADTVLGNFSGTANYPIAGALASCSGATNALTYNTSTHAFGCNTISGGGSGTVNSGTTPGVAYYATTGTAVSDGSAATITTGSIILTTNGTPVNGIGLSAANTVGISASTGYRFSCSSATCQVFAPGLSGSVAGAFALGNSLASSTNATLVPRSGVNSGWGSQASGNISCVISSVERCRFTNEGYIPIQATAPAPTGTGTPTIATGSTDESGEVTAGASATSVIITFNLTHTNAPFCVVNSQTQLAAFAYTLSNTAITITQTATSSNKIDYRCSFH